jgi:hypothetical protein
VDRVESPAVTSHLKARPRLRLHYGLRVPKPMAAGPTQRVGDNAFHLPVTFETCIYSRPTAA